MFYVSLDLETTGLNPDTCDIIEFGAVLDDLNNQKPLDQLPVFHAYILPPDGKHYKGEPMALSFHGEIFKKIATWKNGGEYLFLHPEDLGQRFAWFIMENVGTDISWEDFFNFNRHPKDVIKVTPAGKNFASFDLSFLLKVPKFQHFINLERVEGKECPVSLRRRCIDPASLFWHPEDENLPDTKTCLKRAGILSNAKHTAVEDALDVIQLIRVGTKKMWGL